MTVVLDCDNTLGIPDAEVDDGLALLYLLSRDEISLAGVTTTFGNGSAADALRQTEWLCEMVGKTELAVVPGQEKRGAPPRSSARFLVEHAREHAGELVIVATGPLGNLAAAGALDPQFFSRLAGIVIMGGIRQELRFPAGPVDELNFSADPQAAYTVLTAECPVVLMDAHVCLQAWLDASDIAARSRWPSWLTRSLSGWLAAFRNMTGEARFFLWDLLPAVYVIQPALFHGPVVKLTSSAADLERGVVRDTLIDEHHCSGTMFAHPALSGKGVLFRPSTIADPRSFKDHLLASWDALLGTK